MAAFYERLLGGRMDSTMGGARGLGYEAMHEGRYYAPTRQVFHRGAGYWNNLMSSRYETELNMIYGVPGSENLGYPSTDLVIGGGNNTNQQQHMDVSTGHQTVLSNLRPSLG